MRRWCRHTLIPIVLFAASSASAQVTVGGVDSALDRIRSILADVAELRGLAPLHDVASGRYDRETLREFIIAELDEEIPPERFEIEERILKHWGVLSPAQDYRGLMVDLLSSQIAGFYDDDSETLYLLDDLATFAADPTLAHELLHGIQDQLFDLSAVRGDWLRADDALLAATALIEGDAVAVMIEYTIGGAISFTDIPNFGEMVREQMGSLDPASAGLGDVPQFVLDLMLLPYLAGVDFVHYLKLGGGWERVNQAYRDPPLSTEQVLHPERYVQRDHPTWVELDPSSLTEAGFSLRYDQVFGEAQWRTLLRHLGGGNLAERAIDLAATGWDGDRLLALTNEADELVVISLSVWDTEDDAREFCAVLIRGIELLRQATFAHTLEAAHGSRANASIDGGRMVVERWGDMVLYVDSQYTGEANWATSLWRGRGRSRYLAPNGTE